MRYIEISVAHCRLRQLGYAVVVVLAIAFAAFSQTQITTGTIQGTVTDEKGSVLPEARVEIKILDTNATKTLTTDDGGRFAALAGPIYMLVGVLLTVNGTIMGRQRRRLERLLAMAAEVPD